MMCSDCNYEAVSGAARCAYCEAAARSSRLRKIGGLVFAAGVIAVFLCAASHASVPWLQLVLLLPVGAIIYAAGVIRWLRAPKRPVITNR